MVLVELRRGGDARPPALAAERPAIEAVQRQQARVGRAQAGQQRAQRRLAAARRALQQHAIAAPDLERAARQHGLGASRIAEAEVARADQRARRRRPPAATGAAGRRRARPRRRTSAPPDARRCRARRAQGTPAPACAARRRPAACRPGWSRTRPAARRRPASAGASAATPAISQPRGTTHGQHGDRAIERAPGRARSGQRLVLVAVPAARGGCCATSVRCPTMRSTRSCVSASRSPTSARAPAEPGPPAAAPDRAAARRARQLRRGRDAEREDHGAGHQLEHPRRGDQPAAQRQRLDRLGLDDPAQELADPLGAQGSVSSAAGRAAAARAGRCRRRWPAGPRPTRTRDARPPAPR